MPGRRPKPTALKKIEGNRGKRPLNEHEPMPAIGEPKMPWLPKEAAAEWKRVVPIFKAVGILTVADGPVLAIYCAAFALWQKAQRQLVRQRDLASDKSRKLFSICEKNMKLMKSALVEFGATPASRPRLASFCILPMDKHAEQTSVDPASEYFSDSGSSKSIQ